MTEAIDYSDGKHIEELVAECLRNDFGLTTPTRAHRPALNSAPLLSGPELDDAVVEPDILAVGHANVVWAEVKRKDDGPNPCYARGGQLEHGIEKRLWDDYVAIEKHSGTPLFLFVFEKPSGILLAGRISELARLPPHDAEACRAHYGELMSFAPREDFSPVSISSNSIPNGFEYDVNQSPEGGQEPFDILKLHLDGSNPGVFTDAE